MSAKAASLSRDGLLANFIMSRVTDIRHDTERSNPKAVVVDQYAISKPQIQPIDAFYFHEGFQRHVIEVGGSIQVMDF